MPFLRDRLRDIDAFFFPATCLLCGDLRRTSRLILVCPACRRLLRPVDGPTCLLCRSRDREVAGFAAGRSCRDASHEDFLVHAAVQMVDPADKVVHALKFKDRPELGMTMALLMARRLRRAGAGKWDVVTPLPLHRTRERERGYNQGLMLAGPLARRLKARLEPRLLTRSRSTGRQADLDYAARAANVAGAFRVRDRRRDAERSGLAGQRILLVDDVATTGHTLVQAIEAFRESGAAATSAAVFALA